VPEPNVLIAALLGGALGAAVLLLIASLSGFDINPSRPPNRLKEFLARQRSPLFAVRLVAGVLLALLVGVVTGWPVAAIGLGAMVAFWPALTGGSRIEQRQIARLEVLVAWTESLRDTTAGHVGLEEAIPATAATASPLIRPALARMVGHIRTNVPLEDVLHDLAEQLDHAADMIIAALINNVRRRGDGLVKVLSGLAASSREELDLRRKITASRAGDRRAMQLMLLIVLAVATFLVLFSGGSYTKPYNSVTKQIMLLIVLGMFLGSFLWIRKLAGSRPPSAFLPRAGQRMDQVELQIVAGLTGAEVDIDAAVGQPATSGGPA
jgi:Flp pilus assembly protein TadB